MMTHLAEGIELFNRGEYFEAHEVLEAAWTHAPRRERFFLQGAIHMAVAWHHATQGNITGALRQVGKGIPKLAGYLPHHRGVDTARLCREAMEWRECWRTGAAAATPVIMLDRTT
jgi:hypothetical protein